MEKTPHILNASSNLLGFCFFVLVSMKIGTSLVINFVDEVVAMTILIFSISCFLSYLSMRSRSNASRLEQYAEYFFAVGLILVVFVSAILAFHGLS